MAGATGDSINRSDSFPPALVLQGLPCSAWRGERVRVMLAGHCTHVICHHAAQAESRPAVVWVTRTE